jgi:hypothetical protein
MDFVELCVLFDYSKFLELPSKYAVLRAIPALDQDWFDEDQAPQVRWITYIYQQLIIALYLTEL